MEKNMRQKKSAGRLEETFSRLPETELPEAFRANIMRQVMRTAEAKRRRDGIIGLLMVILASIFMAGLAIVSCLYLAPQRIEIPDMETSSFPFYLSLGGLTLFLLTADYLLRKRYRDRERKAE